MTLSGEFDSWTVWLEVRDRDGRPYPQMYEACPGSTPEEAIDYALELLGQLDDSRVSRAAAAPKALTTIADIEPLRRAYFKRRVDAAKR